MLAVANYHDTSGHYPPAYRLDQAGQPMHSWRVLLLPFVEGQALHARYDFRQPWDSPGNAALLPEMPRTFAFHGRWQPGDTVTNYLTVVGAETVWPGHSTLTDKDVPDGTANTVLIVENLGASIAWLGPHDLRFASMRFRIDDPAEISSPYRGPGVAMLDGQVRSLSLEMSPEVLRALLTVAGGEQLAEGADGAWEVLPQGRPH